MRKKWIPFCNIFLFTFLSFFILFNSVYALDLDILLPDEKLMDNIYAEKEDDFSVIVVEKSSNTLYWVQVSDNVPHVSRVYEVITGKNNGDKEKTGDHKTPEGIYFITRFIPGRELQDPRYGIGAFPLNYPNLVDRINGKTGNGIWIHGRDEFDRDIKTRGCVSLDNKDFSDLRTITSVGDPVIISTKSTFIVPEKYFDQRSRYLGYITKFVSAWQEGDFKTYSGYFNKKFKSASGLSYKSYLKRKKRLMELYPEKSISISDIVILKENSAEFVYEFNQFYCSTNMVSFGRKRLYLVEDGGGTYNIIGERFSRKNSRKYIRHSVDAFVSQWKKSWKTQNFDEYISFYDDSFTNGDMDMRAWEEYKGRLFETVQIRDIVIENIQAKMLAPQRVQVSFTQNYSADNHRDQGIKTLLLTGCPDSYKILSETWQPL